MQVVLPSPRLPGPRAAAKDREPVVWRRTVRFRIGPDIPIRVGAIDAGAAAAKPGMVIRTVAPYLVDDHFQAKGVSACDHPVEIGQRSKARIDAAIIADVVTEILHRRGEEGRDPDSVHSQR